MSVLVAYDGHGVSALHAAKAISLALDLPITVVVVCPSLGRFAATEAALDRAIAVLGLVDCQSVPAANAAEGITSMAEEIDAALIVVGPDLRGRTAHEVARLAHCPVLVAPSDPLLVAAPIRIGVAYDDSIPSHLALVAARRIAESTGGTVKTITAEGRDPARELRAACEDLDLLTCGSHAHGLREMLVGSVSSALIDDPICPVMVVPPRVRSYGPAPLHLTTAAMNR